MKFFRHLLHTIAVLLLPKFLKKSSITCEQYAYLIANSDQNSNLTKAQIKIHNMMCQTCYDYEKQIQIINRECKKLNEVELSPEQLSKIKNSKNDILKKYGS
tara:strand:- start:159316 stop:159621 length:306 start_codon:yes stop_codon:yes gene_type:complete